MSDNLYDLKRDAEQELRDWWENADAAERREPHDQIHEIADSSVPVMNYDLLELAQSDLWLAVEEPELGPAFDGSPTPVNIIAANAYEAIEEYLWEVVRELESEAEEEEAE